MSDRLTPRSSLEHDHQRNEEHEELDEEIIYHYESAEHRRYRLEAEDRERYWRNPDNGWDRTSSVESVIRSPLPASFSTSNPVGSNSESNPESNPRELAQASERTLSSASASEHESPSPSPSSALLTPEIEPASSTNRPSSTSSAGILQAERPTTPAASTTLRQVERPRSLIERHLPLPTRSSRPPLPTTIESPLVQTSQASRSHLYALRHRNRNRTSAAEFPVYTDPVAPAPVTPSSGLTPPALSRAPLRSIDINATPRARTPRTQATQPASATNPQLPRRRPRSITIHDGENPVVTPLVDADFRLARIANQLREENLHTDLRARQHAEEERRRLTEETASYFIRPHASEQANPSLVPQSNLGFLRHQERQFVEPRITRLQEYHTRREERRDQQEAPLFPSLQEHRSRYEDRRDQQEALIFPSLQERHSRLEGRRDQQEAPVSPSPQERHSRREGRRAHHGAPLFPSLQENPPRREILRSQSPEELIPASLRRENNRDGWRGEHFERSEAEIQHNRRLAAEEERRQARAALTQSGGYRGTATTRPQQPRAFDREDRDRTPRPHDRRPLPIILTPAPGGETITEPEQPLSDQDSTQFTLAPRSDSKRNNLDPDNPDRRVLAVFALPEPPIAVFEQLYSKKPTDTKFFLDFFNNLDLAVVKVPDSAEPSFEKPSIGTSHNAVRPVSEFSLLDRIATQDSLQNSFNLLNFRIGYWSMNYSQYSDASQGGSNPRQAPPSPSQGASHSNGMNNGMAAGTGLVGFPTPAGHQSDLNYVMSMVEELSGILRVNQQLTASVVDKMGKVREKAKHLNLTNDEMIATVAQEINEESENLEKENSELRKALDRSEHSRSENFKLAVHGAEIIGDIAEKLHHFKEQQEVDTLAWHKNYRKQLAEEREENLNLRNQINDMKAAACRASESLRQMRRFVTDNNKWTELEIENHRLHTEKRFWKRCALPLIPDDDSEWSDDDDLIDPEEKKREAAKKEKERQNKEDGEDQLS